VNSLPAFARREQDDFASVGRGPTSQQRLGLSCWNRLNGFRVLTMPEAEAPQALTRPNEEKPFPLTKPRTHRRGFDLSKQFSRASHAFIGCPKHERGTLIAPDGHASCVCARCALQEAEANLAACST